MSKSKIVVVFAGIIFVACVLFLVNQSSNNKMLGSKIENNIKTQSAKKKQISDMMRILEKSSKPLDLEEKFNEQTGLKPLRFDEVEKLEGEALQKRCEELDVKLDYAIRKNHDLPPIPEWYTRERDYIENKFFATVGKSRYKTELTEEQKEKRQKYLNYLEEIKKSGAEISDEELAKTKEQILGE